MADLYLQTIVGDGVGTHTVGANNRKTVESTTFGTRDLVFLQINANQDITTGYTEAGSVFQELIQCLQQAIEIYTVGIPNGTEVTVVANRQTVPYAPGEEADSGGTVQALETLLNASATFSNTSVFHGKIRGWSIQNDC